MQTATKQDATARSAGRSAVADADPPLSSPLSSRSPMSPESLPAESGGAPTRALIAPAKAKPALIVLAAVFTELVVIAAIGNQWIAEKLLPDQSTGSLATGIRTSALTYAWRVSPIKGDSQHLYAGAWTIIGGTVLLSALLIVAVVRGPVTFGRAFFGTWMAVPVATMIGAYVRAFVVEPPLQPGESQASRGLFGTLAPNGATFIAGLVLGLVVAVVAAYVAVLSRRPAEYVDEPEPYDDLRDALPIEPSTRPWQDRYYGPPPQTYGGAGSAAPTYAGGIAGAASAGATTELPSLRKDDHGSDTADLPREAEPVRAEAPRDSDSTTVLPSLRKDDHGSDTADLPREAEPVRAEAPRDSDSTTVFARPTDEDTTASDSEASRNQPHHDESSSDHQSTAQFPRPPDDEDLHSDMRSELTDTPDRSATDSDEEHPRSDR